MRRNVRTDRKWACGGKKSQKAARKQRAAAEGRWADGREGRQADGRRARVSDGLHAERLSVLRGGGMGPVKVAQEFKRSWIFGPSLFSREAAHHSQTIERRNH